MIRLTDWETGNPAFIDETKIDVVRRLQPSVIDYGDRPTELGGRTRINICGDILLVRETPSEVMALTLTANELDRQARDKRMREWKELTDARTNP